MTLQEQFYQSIFLRGLKDRFMYKIYVSNWKKLPAKKGLNKIKLVLLILQYCQI